MIDTGKKNLKPLAWLVVSEEEKNKISHLCKIAYPTHGIITDDNVINNAISSSTSPE